MAITTCINPHAAGFNPNDPSTNTPEAQAVHMATHETTHKGLVLKLVERNGYDDSDFVALVWDEETQSVKEVCYASTRYWTYHNNASVDASPKIMAKAIAWEAERLAESQTREELSEVSLGTLVRSTVTRGKNKGVQGMIVWVGKDQYRTTRYVAVERYGIKVEGESQLRYLSQDQVARVEASLTPERQAEIIRTAQWNARRTYA